MKKNVLILTLITILILTSIYGLHQKARADKIEEKLLKELKMNEDFRKQMQEMLDEAKKVETQALEIEKQKALAGEQRQVSKKKK